MDQAVEQQTVNLFYEFKVETYTILTAIVLLLYDTILTLPDEIAFIWKGKVNFGAVLYILARYITLSKFSLDYTLFMLNLYDESITVQLVTVLSRTSSVIDIGAVVTVQLILAARAYSVSGGNRAIGLGLLLLVVVNGSFQIALATFPVVGALSKVQVIWGKKSIILTSITKFREESVVNIPSLILEAAVMVITVYYAWSMARNALQRSKEHDKPSLWMLFLRQGALRFVIIFLWSLSGSIKRQLLPGDIASFDTPLENSISVILVCRFILQLRTFTSETRTDTTHVDTLRTLSDFRARTLEINESIIDEFGNSMILRGGLPDRDSETQADFDTTEEEFPYIGGEGQWNFKDYKGGYV
ncbi:hypothetical protein M422DRAFT_776303 [Sphaerobolus stellatus SS14]|nr:hypothetical protein M422DRAFT_776303 [Sphaerobolus stellatus SS14]